MAIVKINGASSRMFGAKTKSKSQYPRPLNSFMLFKKSVTEFIISTCVINNSADVSRIAGTMWTKLSDKEKKPFLQEYEDKKIVWSQARVREQQSDSKLNQLIWRSSHSQMGTEHDHPAALKKKPAVGTARASKKVQRKSVMPSPPVSAMYHYGGAPLSFFSATEHSLFMDDRETLLGNNQFSIYSQQQQHQHQPEQFQSPFNNHELWANDQVATYLLQYDAPSPTRTINTARDYKSSAYPAVPFPSSSAFQDSFCPSDYFTFTPAQFESHSDASTNFSPLAQDRSDFKFAVDNSWMETLLEVEFEEEAATRYVPSPLPTLPSFAEFCKASH